MFSEIQNIQMSWKGDPRFNQPNRGPVVTRPNPADHRNLGPTVTPSTTAQKAKIEITKNPTQNVTIQIKRPTTSSNNLPKPELQPTPPETSRGPFLQNTLTNLVRPISPQTGPTPALFSPHPHIRPQTPNVRNYVNQPYPQSLNDRQPIRFPPVSAGTPSPLPDSFCRYSLVAFVSSFEKEQNFNETPLEDLGIDLDTDQPLLPLLHSVLSEAPLLSRTYLDIPKSYGEITPPTGDKTWLFSEETLLLIFYTQPGQPQVQAANELLNRFHYTWEEEQNLWKTPSGKVWDYESWKEANHMKEVSD